MAIVTRKNRETETMISVGRAQADFGLCNDVPPCWMTICEDHGFLVTHRTRKLAEWHAPNPSGWCEGCRKIIYTDVDDTQGWNYDMTSQYEAWDIEDKHDEEDWHQWHVENGTSQERSEA